jgi:hypothetical protein
MISEKVQLLDPDETLDYVINWLDELDGDTIFTSVWITQVGLTIEQSGFTTTQATVWLTPSGSAQINGEYKATNHIQSVGGREFDQSIWLKIQAK